MDGLEDKAKATGGSKLYLEDLREEFVRDYVWTSVKANALYEGVYLMGTSLARPVIAKRHIEIARQENADAVAHGATGKGNDQVRRSEERRVGKEGSSRWGRYVSKNRIV